MTCDFATDKVVYVLRVFLHQVGATRGRDDGDDVRINGEASSQNMTNCKASRDYEAPFMAMTFGVGGQCACRATGLHRTGFICLT